MESSVLQHWIHPVDSLHRAAYTDKCRLCLRSVTDLLHAKGLESDSAKAVAHWNCFLGWKERAKRCEKFFQAIRDQAVATSLELEFCVQDADIAIVLDRGTNEFWIIARDTMSRCVISTNHWTLDCSPRQVPRGEEEREAALEGLRLARARFPVLAELVSKADFSRKDAFKLELEVANKANAEFYARLMPRLSAILAEQPACPHCLSKSRDHRLVTPGLSRAELRVNPASRKTVVDFGRGAWTARGVYLACAKCGGSFAPPVIERILQESLERPGDS